MTPKELLEHVCARFSVLQVEPDKRLILLKDALGTYGEKAGVTKTIRIRAYQTQDGEPYIDYPEAFAGVLQFKDNYSEIIRHELLADESIIRVNPRDARQPLPWTLSYFVALRNVNIDTFELPDRIIGLLGDYLQVLIEIPNYERMKNAMAAGQMDNSHLPTDADLQARKEALQMLMGTNRVAIPMSTIG